MKVQWTEAAVLERCRKDPLVEFAATHLIRLEKWQSNCSNVKIYSKGC